MLILLLVVVRVVDAFHEGLAVVDFICEGGCEEGVDRGGVDYAGLHCLEVVVLVDFAPVDA